MDHCLRAAAPILQRSLHLRSGSLTYSVFGDVKAEETCFYHHGWWVNCQSEQHPQHPCNSCVSSALLEHG
jgi:hypothetical protein